MITYENRQLKVALQGQKGVPGGGCEAVKGIVRAQEEEIAGLREQNKEMHRLNDALREILRKAKWKLGQYRSQISVFLRSYKDDKGYGKQECYRE